MTYEINLNIEKTGIKPRIKLSQYDNETPVIEAKLYSNGQPYTIPSGSTVYISGTKKDNTGFQYECTYSGNTVTAEVTSQMTVFSGDVEVEFTITNGTAQKSTQNFILEVEKSALQDDVEISETDIPIIEQLPQMIQEMKDEVELAHNWANYGDESEEPSANNNSKYWSDVSGDNAELSHQWATYGSSSENPSATNNAKYWSGVAQQYAQGGLHYSGSITFANIPTTGMNVGDMYNIEDDFTTDSRFQEGSGASVKAGSNIAWNPNDKWDVLALGGGGGTSDYTDLTNKPQINGVTLSGNKTSADLGISGGGDKRIADRHILFVMDSLGTLKDTSDRYVDEAIHDLTEADCYRVAQSGASLTRGEFEALVTNYSGDTDIIDTVVLIGGGNDQAYTENDILTGATSFFTTCKTKFPNAHDYFVMCPGLTFSTIQNSAFTIQNRESVWKYYKKSAFLNGAKYADNSQYILRNTALLRSDFTHPTQSGMDVFIDYIRDYLCNGYMDVHYELDTQFHSVGNIWTHPVRMTRDNGICSITFGGGIPAFCIADVVNDTTGNSINTYGTFEDSLVDNRTSTGINDIGGACVYVNSGTVYHASGSIYISEKSAQGFVLKLDASAPTSGTDLKFVTENYTLHN